jgi:S-DNA-T family DNA segregation ATPase FtsK/SpoIIIE
MRRHNPPKHAAKKRPKAAHARRATPRGGEVKAVVHHHRADLWGMAFLALGVIAGLGIYMGGAGVFGHAVDVSLGTVVGTVRYVAPVIFLLTGVFLLRARQEEEANVRNVLGLLLGLAALTGLFHVLRFSSAGDPVSDLSQAGGVVGAVAGQPLVKFAGDLGAGVLLFLVLTISALVLTRTTVRVASQATAAALAPGGRLLVRGIQNLFHGGLTGGVEEEDDDVIGRSGPVFPDDGASVDQPRRPRRTRARQTLGASMGDEPDGDGTRDLKADPADLASDTTTMDLRAGTQVVVPRIVLPAEPPVADEGDDEADDLDDGELAVADPELGAPGPRDGVEWKVPPAKLLDRSGAQEVDRAMVERTGRTLEHALAEHGVETRLVGMVVGPTVTRYELELGPGVKVARVTSLHRDIAYAMATPDVRILAPIPGRQAIGVEVANLRRQLVTVGDILGSEEARKADHPLEVAIGRDIMGRAVLANLATMPHLLIAGATGAGKSSCINSLITSILMRTTPDQVRMILVDPKRVELGQYNRLPHLLTQVVTNPKKAANALSWTVREMERRYDLLSEVGVRDITGYNAAYDRGDLAGETSEILRKALGHLPEGAADLQFPRLPYILVVVDELNDLMRVAARDVEDSICRIAQMARAVGIHLVIATQRPSVNVITGVIKANVPSRIAFAVSSLADSRVILDQQGAERLVGRGDMLLLGPSSSIPQRIQGAWVTEDEVRAVAAHWRRQCPEVNYVEGVEGSDDDQASLFDLGSGGGGGDDEDDAALVRQARELVVRSQLGSTSMLQRKLRVGFARAGRLMDLLEQQGVVGPSIGSKAREVLMTPEELDELGTRA